MNSVMKKEDLKMNDMNTISCLFLDIGGVLLSDGWDDDFIQRAVEHFHIDADEMEDTNG